MDESIQMRMVMKNKYLKTDLFFILMVHRPNIPEIIDRKPAIALQTQLTSINKIHLETLFTKLVNVRSTDYLFDRTGEIDFFVSLWRCKPN